MSEDESIWSFSSPDDGTAFPEHLVELVWSWWQTPMGRVGIKPRSKEALGILVNAAFAASLQSEEGRPVRLQLLFDPHEREVTAIFDDPLPYSASNLVKLAPTIDIGFRSIVVAPEQPGHDALTIIGVTDLELSQLANKPMRLVGGGLTTHPAATQSMKLSVFGPGCVRIDTSSSFFELRDCSIRFPFSVSRIKYVREWYEEAGQQLDFSHLPEDPVVGNVAGWADRRQFDGQQLVRRTWGSILNKVCNARHGGTFLVVPKHVDVSAHLRLTYATKSNQLQVAIHKRASFEPGLSNPHYRTSMAGSNLDDAHFSERDLARTSDLVASFAAVDGAVVLERDLTVLGFGAEILETEIPNENEFVKYGRHPHGRPDDKPLTGFGMRHRSAYRFCKKLKGAIAFVISQDGGLRVFCNPDGRVVAYEGPTPEDWVSPSVRRRDTSEVEEPRT